jgi:Ca-activated chloride channel family protein
MMTEKTLKISAQLERKLAWHRGQSVRHVVCELEAPKMVREENEQEARINLALVLDTSGSMHGEPLQTAKQTALAIAELLSEEDVLTVVTFDSFTEVVLQKVTMSDEGKDLARRQISGIQTRGMTNLSGGWFEGAKQLSEVMEEDQDYVHHLILLSDGRANEGLLDVDKLCEHVSEMRELGMSTSCVGFSDNYEMKWLEKMAEAGGGRLHDAEHPQEIAEVLMGELGEVRQTVLEDVRVVIQGAEGVRVDLLERYGTMSKHNGLEVILGSLISEAKRMLVFVVTLPSGEIGSKIPLVIHAEYKSAGGEQVRLTEEISLGIELARGADNDQQQRNLELARLIAEHWKTQILHHCMQLNRDRAYREATEYAQRQYYFLTRFCQGVAGTETILREIGFVAERVSNAINERSRKNIQLRMRKDSLNEMEHRSEKRDFSLMQELRFDLPPRINRRGPQPPATGG